MPKDAAELDDWVAERNDWINNMTDMALCSAAEAKGSALDDDEVEEILAWCGWWVLCLAHDLDVAHWVEALRAEAKGTATVH